MGFIERLLGLLGRKPEPEPEPEPELGIENVSVKYTGGAVVVRWTRRSDSARFKEVYTIGTHVLG